MMENRIKYRHLQCFLEVTRQGSVVRAADALALTQPAVSKKLKELEDILGVRLLERSKKGVELTPFGDVFLEHASTSVAALREGTEHIAQVQKKCINHISIGVLPTVATSVLPESVKRFRADNIEAHLHLISGPNSSLMAQLRVGELDLVVGRLAVPEAMSGLSFQHLYSEQVTFAVRPEHPLLSKDDFHISDIANYTILYPPKGSITGPYVDRFLLSQGVGALNDRIDTVSDSFGKEFIRNNDAIWIISRGVVAREIADGALSELPIDTKETLGAVGLTTRSDSTPSMALKLFMKAIRDTAKNLDNYYNPTEHQPKSNTTVIENDS
ncbi:pca operon transcription factor PcaQ [Marinomonas mediterranea]|uniref:Transcriptional regulator, LysR family n=1 Tax=Marinomonas mediterranea (strain ATCC 700492 / JCM 21426 / NBRC 103028 / MMB-1) TaxID=717774 RepID=F2JX86_MARM1|nr:pca operon transcription factor PcaQ [Marinomonas mediterranea]ADZ90692.1 transcriptional regulator, LysR family [Marinomonas mediterranea MMB-1]WCN12785.1 pca operon transcription factor PcaQ [Marinomonas mediterranea]WCN16856.1 pca operon transcription factor PcaQ [Marinomonas mediterranea MMB-1]